MTARICHIDNKPCHTWYDDNKGLMCCRNGLIFDKCTEQTDYYKISELIKFMRKRK